MIAPPTSDDIRAAAVALEGLVVRTPVLQTEGFDAFAGTRVVAKAECLQVTGSFKVRGALNRVRTFDQAQRDAGLITISSGNAALGAAYAARHHGARLTVVMPHNAVAEKLNAVRSYGATVVNDGVTNASIAFERAAQLQDTNGLTLVHPFDDPMVIAGAATATLELLEQAPDVERIYVPCSGGGPLAGAALVARAMAPSVEVVGVQPAGADSFARSLRAGTATIVDQPATVADALTAPQPGALNLSIVRDSGVRVITVTDEQILSALAVVIRTLRVVIEPAGATAVAGLLAERPGVPSAVLLTGSNVKWSLLADVVSAEFPGD